MTSESPPTVVKATETTTSDSGKQQATFYASPLPQHRSLIDVAGRCSPQPPRYSSRPQSPPIFSSSVDPNAHGQASNDRNGHRHSFQSPSSQDRDREREHDIRRAQSPLPRIVSNEDSTPAPSATVGSLESVINNYSLYSRRALSPRPMLGSRGQSGDGSAPNSFDSEHLRSIGRNNTGNQSHSRNNSAEGKQSFKGWGPYNSPVPLHRMQQKPYVPTNLSNNDEADRSKDRASPPLQHPKLHSAESNRRSEGDKMDVDKPDADSREHSNQQAGSKRKDREEEGAGKEQIANHSHFRSLAPPSSHLYGSMEASRQEKLFPSQIADESHRKGLQQNEQEQDELEDDSSDDVRHRPTRTTTDGMVLTLAPQRKSCDRCFKMKTKCSRAAPGATSDGPCEGCVRRGYGNDCVTSRPDYPYPRITLPKRARRESSLPTLLDPNNKDAAVYVPPSMQRGSDWRSKLVINSMQRGNSEGYNQVPQHRQQTVHHSMAGKRSVTPQPLPLRSHSSHLPSQPTTWQLHGHPAEVPSSNAARSHSSHLRSLPTSELQDLSLRIAHEVTQRSQPPPLPMTTPIVPSNSGSGHHGKPQLPPQQGSGNAAARVMQQPSSGSLGQQAMQNAPMQLLPKATGLPALQYFDQFIYPLYSLSALSSTTLLPKYESYIKPGRNNILELAMAIGLQLQGILLACPDKSQVNTAEGHIFKAFIQTSRPQGDKSVPAVNDSSKVSIESVKGWLEPSRHRGRAKDIVKHVMMRRCLKSGCDYDDVVETSLLGYYHLLRGEVSSFYVCIGNAQRQVALLEIQQNPRDAALWSAQDMRVLQAKAAAMDRLHPISFYSLSAPSASTVKGEEIADNDFNLIQEKLSEIACFAQTREIGKLDAEVDEQLSALKKSLPIQLQPSIRSEWLTTTCGRVDSDWISDMIRGESTMPSLRLNIYLNICFMRLIARQPRIVQALNTLGEEEGLRASVDSEPLQSVCQVEHTSSSVIASTLLAFTVFPHLICLSQFFAAELTSSAWNYIISQLLLLDSASQEQRQEMQEGMKRMEDKLTSLVEYLNASQEKESWLFAASLEMVKSIIKTAREDENGASKWMIKVSRFSKTHQQAFSRLLKGDACAVDTFRKQTTDTETTAINTTTNNTTT